MRFNVLPSLLIGGLAAVGIIYFMWTDPYRMQAESFVRENHEVRAEVGMVADVSLRRLFTYQGSEVEAPYREYSFSVKGVRGRARVIVRAHPTSIEKKYDFDIRSIERP